MTLTTPIPGAAEGHLIAIGLFIFDAITHLVNAPCCPRCCCRCAALAYYASGDNPGVRDFASSALLAVEPLEFDGIPVQRWQTNSGSIDWDQLRLFWPADGTHQRSCDPLEAPDWLATPPVETLVR